MPGYWFDDRPSDAPSSYNVGAGHSSYDRDPPGGGGQQQGPPGQPATGPHIGYEPIATIEETITAPIIEPEDPREQAILEASTPDLPINVPPITQTPTGGPYGGFSTPQQQAAASLLGAGALTSGALSGQALWTQAPVGSDPLLQQAIDENSNVFFSSFGPGAQAYSPTGLIQITGDSGIPAFLGRDENGNLIPNPDPRANQYTIFNPYPSESFDESFAMDPFYDEWDYQYGSGGGEEEMERLLGGRWASDPTPTEMVSMGEMEPIFGEELDPGREASWLYLTGTPQFRDRTIYS